MSSLEDWSYQEPPDHHPRNGDQFRTGFGGDYSAQSHAVAGARMVHFAPNRMRYAAGVVDWVVPFLVEWILFQGHLQLLLLVYYVGNSVVLQGRTGQSVGKKVCGDIVLAHVIHDEADDFWSWYTYPGMGRCAWRFVCHAFDLIALWGFLIRPLYNGRNRTYADTFASTSVYKQHNLNMWKAEDARADREANKR